ncbi:MAG TPA: FecR family protein [Acidisphaera sp.]|nr:FecR family protein [Acidisphaera sp.]
MVEALRGEAYAMEAAGRRTLAPAAEVSVGDLVSTAAQSSLGMRLGMATEVRLGPEAQLRIDRFLVNVGGVLELARGSMVFDHAPTAGGIDVTVRSPFGLMAVRGTRFFAGPSNGVFGVFVVEGTVLVVGSNTSVEVTKGLGTDIVRPGAEPTNPHPWGAARIATALASVT